MKMPYEPAAPRVCLTLDWAPQHRWEVLASKAITPGYWYVTGVEGKVRWPEILRHLPAHLTDPESEPFELHVRPI